MRVLESLAFLYGSGLGFKLQEPFPPGPGWDWLNSVCEASCTNHKTESSSQSMCFLAFDAIGRVQHRGLLQLLAKLTWNSETLPGSAAIAQGGLRYETWWPLNLPCDTDTT